MATPSANFHMPGPGNVFIPGSTFQKDPGASGLAVVNFSRNPNDFAINRYAQLIPGVAQSGLYPELSSDDAVRVVNQQDFIWPDGDDAPVGTNQGLLWKKFTTVRSAYPFMIGEKAAANASYDVVASHATMKLATAMTARTRDVLEVVTTAANWRDNTSATLDALGVTGGSWLSSATTELFIQKSFQKVAQTISKNTGGVVRPSDITCVINPVLANNMALTAEFRAYIVNNESAMNALQGNAQFSTWGIPPQMYGVNIVVEDAAYVSSRLGAATTTRAFALGDTQAFFTSRVGGLVGTEGPNFSTVLGFMHEEMTVETKNDPDNRRINGRVVEDRDFVIAAPTSGYLIENVST